MSNDDFFEKGVSIIGIGRVGLPLAVYLAEKGFTVYGIDISEDIIISCKNNKIPFYEKGLRELLEKTLGKNFFPVHDYKHIQETKIIILTIGTPVDEHLNPVFSYLEDALKRLLPYLKKGHLLILRSTISPGTTQHLKRMIEEKTGFQVGKDIYLAFCPERIAEGYSIEELPNIPQIVGGVDEKSTRVAADFFAEVASKVLASDSISAELAKLFTNMYRYIDFAIANEFMMIAEQFDRDIYEIIDLVNRDYKRAGLKKPGFTAGPCLYKDGFFLISKTPYSELITTSWKIHETLPAFLIERIKGMKDIRGSKVALLGLSFKKNIDDTRNSLAYKAKKIFLLEECKVHLHDPILKIGELTAVLEGSDILFFAVDHDFYKEIGFDYMSKLIKKDAIICDVWNILGRGKIIFRNHEIA
jgi:UDP-N-acetyl-D-mannosaminuronic acid dehydrogenase